MRGQKVDLRLVRGGVGRPPLATGLSVYLQEREFVLSKNVDVALWLDYRMFTNQASLEVVYDFVGVNDTLFNDIQRFWQQHASPGFSQFPVIKI